MQTADRMAFWDCYLLGAKEHKKEPGPLGNRISTVKTAGSWDSEAPRISLTYRATQKESALPIRKSTQLLQMADRCARPLGFAVPRKANIIVMGVYGWGLNPLNVKCNRRHGYVVRYAK